MKVKDIMKVVDAELLVGEENLDLDIKAACGSDLMSDVMAYVKENVVMFTGLINLQVIRTAEMMDIKVVTFVRGKKPDENMIALAREKGITLLTTKNTMYIACGKLYSAGVTERGVWS